MKIGFVGQGFVGKSYADDFERRGLEVLRYALEEPYRGNKEQLASCGIVFIAVPTPTTPEGFDSSIVAEAISYLAPGTVAVIKSTVIPGRTKELQQQFPDRIVVFSPEFLGESTAAFDAAHPWANVVGLPVDDEKHRKAAETVHSVLPACNFSLTCDSTEAEFVKYAHNTSGYIQIVTFNLFYDLAQKLGADWDVIQKVIEVDPLISNRYAYPVHKSGRGAGGHCFIKDFAAIREYYAQVLPSDTVGLKALESLERKNIEYLRSSNKDIPLVEGVYGTSPDA